MKLLIDLIAENRELCIGIVNEINRQEFEQWKNILNSVPGGTKKEIEGWIGVIF